MIVETILLLSYYIAAVIMHELGHLWAIKKIAPDRPTKLIATKEHIGIQVDLEGLSCKDKINIYMAGISAGLIIFLLILGQSGLSLRMIVLLMLIYLIGCRDDFIHIIRCKA